MSDKENQSGVNDDDDAITPDAENEDQVWQQLTGQEGGETSSEDSSDDNQEADADQTDEENAPEAISEEDDGDNGHDANEQRPDHDEQREKRLRGIISGKDRALNAKEREIRDLQKQIASFQSSKTEDKGGETASLEALREEYPDLLGPLMDRLDKMDQAQSGLQEQFGAVSRLHGAQLESHVDEQISILAEKMPDWQSMVQENAEAFWNWVDDQPKTDRELAEASQDVIQDAEATYDLLSRFHAHLTGEEPHQQQGSAMRSDPKPNRGAKSRRLAGAKSVASRGSQSATGSPQPDETDEVAVWNSLT